MKLLSKKNTWCRPSPDGNGPLPQCLAELAVLPLVLLAVLPLVLLAVLPLVVRIPWRHEARRRAERHVMVDEIKKLPPAVALSVLVSATTKPFILAPPRATHHRGGQSNRLRWSTGKVPLPHSPGHSVHNSHTHTHIYTPR